MGLQWLNFTTLWDWSRNLNPFSKTTRRKTNYSIKYYMYFTFFFAYSPACTSRCFKQVARLDYLFVCNVLYSSYHLVWPQTKIVTVVTGGKYFPLRTICYYEKKRIELGREEFSRKLNKLRETNGNIRDMHYSPS